LVACLRLPSSIPSQMMILPHKRAPLEKKGRRSLNKSGLNRGKRKQREPRTLPRTKSKTDTCRFSPPGALHAAHISSLLKAAASPEEASFRTTQALGGVGR
jgi:hypothetical protein